MTKIIDVLWFTGSQCIGIVCAETDQGERKFYIGRGDGEDEERDKRAVADWGVKIQPDFIRRWFERMEGKCQE